MKFAVLCIVLLCLTTSDGRILTQENSASASTSVSSSGGTTEAESNSVSSTDGPVSVSVTLTAPTNPASSPVPSPSPMASPSVVPSPTPQASPSVASTPAPTVPPPAVSSPPPTTSGPSDGDGRSRLDIYFLVDTTIGMEAAIELLQRDREDFLAEVYGLADEVHVGVGEYKDVEDSPAFRNILPITNDQDNAVSAILSLRASGGGDTRREAQLYALETVATDSGIVFEDEATKVIVWIGDQPGYDPALESTEASATAALQESEIHVIAIDVLRLNAAGQAARIANATNGVFRKVDLEGFVSEATSVTVANESGSASASGSGDTVMVSAQAGEESATASSEDQPPLQEVILDSLESLIS